MCDAGTLTQNIMGFVWCSIGGRLYGKEAPTGLNTPHTITQDPALLKALESQATEQYQQAADFLTHLAICNTVVPATDALGHLIYQVCMQQRVTDLLHCNLVVQMLVIMTDCVNCV